MKLEDHIASETKTVLKAVYKRFYTEWTMEYEAEDDEATEMGTQQQCILNGGVYLRHRLEKRAFQKICLLCFSQHRYYNITVGGVRMQTFRRAGVQETVPLPD